MSNLIKSNYQEDEKHDRIGGWLILPATGLICSCFFGFINLMKSLAMFPKFSTAGYGVIYFVFLLISFVFLTYLAITTMFFFERRQIAPAFVIVLLFANILISFIFLAGYMVMGYGEILLGKQTATIIVDIIMLAIWIPYFKSSKRVKATFIN
jgi:hypothetical protein